MSDQSTPELKVMDENAALDLPSFSAMRVSFLGNLGALRECMRNMVPVAAEQDIRILESRLRDLCTLLHIEELLPPTNDPLEDEPLYSRIARAGPGPFAELMRTRVQTVDHAALARFMSQHADYPDSPTQTRLLSQGLLMTLVSYSEALETELLRAYYRYRPNALPPEVGSLTLGELREAGSIQAAELALIDRELVSYSFKSFSDQRKYLQSRLNLDLGCVAKYNDQLVELTLRRNLFTHNSGIVNRVYLTQAPRNFVERENIQRGDQLSISRSYLSAAIDLLTVYGLVLHQLCWRKAIPEEHGLADHSLVESTFELLCGTEYGIVTELWPAVRNLVHADDCRRLCTINEAIALKEMGRPDEMETLLNTLDWSACSLKFSVGLAALRDDYSALADLVPRALASGDIQYAGIASWPVFMHYRETKPFAELSASNEPPLLENPDRDLSFIGKLASD